MIFAIVVLLSFLAVLGSSIPAVKLFDSGRYVQLSNGYLSATLDKVAGSITSLTADFLGSANYGANSLAKPYMLEVSLNGTSTADKLLCNSANEEFGVKYVIKSLSETSVVVSLSGISDCATKPTVLETWDVTLVQGSRQLLVSIAGKTVQSASIKSIYHGLYSAAASQYALFDKGVVQMMNDRGRCFASNESLPRTYWIAGDGKGLSLDIQRDASDLAAAPRNVVLLSQDTAFQSALLDFVVADLHYCLLPRLTSGPVDVLMIRI